LDASAAVEVALWTDDGERLSRHVVDAAEVVVPDHFHLEATTALRRLELREEISAEEATAAFEHVLALRARRVDTVPLLAEAWRLRHNITTGDALYVVLARRLGTALVTGDAKLSRAPHLDVEIRTAS
jgi:predicted nucleic acid-binding protein